MYKQLCLFFFNDTATTEIYTLSLHDALPISEARFVSVTGRGRGSQNLIELGLPWRIVLGDRKSTRLNSSHGYISYAVFCLKKKKKNKKTYNIRKKKKKKKHKRN